MYYLANKNVEFWEFQILVDINHESFMMTSIIDHAFPMITLHLNLDVINMFGLNNKMCKVN
jgi:hypothetical protein